MTRAAAACITLALVALGAPCAWAEVAGPSAGTVGARFLGAMSTVTVLLALTLVGLRWVFQRAERIGGRGRLRRPAGARAGWLARFMPAGRAAAARVEILGRSYVGAKESVCVIGVGPERFLVGVTAHRITLLGKLEAPGAPAAEARAERIPREPAPDDFARELSGAVGARPQPSESSMRAMLARSRERLARLGVNSVHAGGPRA